MASKKAQMFAEALADAFSKRIAECQAALRAKFVKMIRSKIYQNRDNPHLCAATKGEVRGVLCNLLLLVEGITLPMFGEQRRKRKKIDPE